MTALTTLERQVSAAIRRAGFADNACLVVACSGGPDSTALLRCLHRLRDEYSLSLHVAHLNHDFRGAEADHDAAFVQVLADGLGLPCSIDKQDPIAYQRERGVSSFEQAAREMRYSFLASVAGTVGAGAIVLGHTADDQAETVLLHLLRGSGLHGLRGMSELGGWPWPEPKPGPRLFRPMLGVGKDETAGYCEAIGQTFRQDSGNYMWRFTRNRVRLDLVPRLSRDYNPRVRDALARLSRAAAEQVDYIEGELASRWNEIAYEDGESVAFSAGALAGLHPALQRQALRRAYATAAGDSRTLVDAHLEAMLSLLHRRRGGRSLNLPRGVWADLQGGVLRVARRPEASSVPGLEGEHTLPVPKVLGEPVQTRVEGWMVTLELLPPGNPGRTSEPGGDAVTTCLDREALGDAITVRSRRPGDRFQPQGMSGTKKLQDFFTDAKVPREQRDDVPLLVCERGIAWVVGHRVAAWAVTGDYATVIRVSLSRA